jgi:hypothetical protein
MDRHLQLLKAGACAIYDNEKIKPGQGPLAFRKLGIPNDKAKALIAELL